MRPLKNSSRIFKNGTAMELAEIERANWDNMTFEKVATLMAGTRGRAAERDGDADAGTFAAGQGIGLIDDVLTCQEVMDVSSPAKSARDVQLPVVSTCVWCTDLL